MIIPLLVFSLFASAPLELPAHVDAIGPRLTSSKGKLHLSWMESIEKEGKKNGRAMRLSTSSFDGNRWSTVETIVERPDVFANWADFPSVVSSLNGTLYAHWLQKRNDEKYAYDIYLARRTKKGWQHLGLLHHDGTATEHGFVSMVPLKDGVQIFWLDGRKTAQKGPMTLRTARVIGRKIQRSVVVDERVCDCCNTAAAATQAGPRVVYRDRKEREIRDISSALVVKGRAQPSIAVHKDQWKMPGCPVNGPAFSAPRSTTGQAAATWYTEAGGKPSVRVAFLQPETTSGPAAFTQAVVVEGDQTLGRVDQIFDGEDVLVSSLNAMPFANPGSAKTPSTAEGALQIRRISPDGKTGAPFVYGHAAKSRRSGFSQIEVLGDEVIAIWTHVEGKKTSLRGSRFPLASVPGAKEAGKIVGKTTENSIHGKHTSLPDLRLLDDKGQKTSIPKNKATVLHLWATWCAPCLQEMPSLLKLLRQESDAQVFLLSVDDKNSFSRARELAKKWHASDLLRFDVEGQAEAELQVTSLPVTFVFDRDGKLLKKWTGKTPQHELRQALQIIQK